MKVKVAAKEIVERFINIIPCNDNELSEDEMYKEQLHSAKQCALICVDEILCFDLRLSDIEFLKEVEQEIIKL
jgi:hypothetical protein|tara:strand:+ start:1211 stop:1429 length:219 start_codon:yes stop_codon:yes gene_type:complete